MNTLLGSSRRSAIDRPWCTALPGAVHLVRIRISLRQGASAGELTRQGVAPVKQLIHLALRVPSTLHVRVGASRRFLCQNGRQIHSMVKQKP